MKVEQTKDDVFIKHIQAHLQEGDKVICKICGKDVDSIYEEERLKKEYKKR